MIEALAGELRFAGKGTLVRHLERIEGLAPGVEVNGVYPAEFLVFRVTGYRAQELGTGGLDEMVPGEAVLGDLSALAERLSEAAHLSMEDVGEAGRDHWTIDGLAERWGVSRKSVERYRRKGLVARRVDLGSGRRSVVFMNSAVEWFEVRHADRLGSAGGFSRMSDSMRQKIVRDAERYVRRLGWNRSRVCERIGQRIGRSSESVRRVLMDHDEGLAKGERIFVMAGIADGDERMSMLRESLRGKRSGTIGARFGRSAMSVSRGVNRARRGLILDSGFGVSAVDMDDAADVSVLDEAVVRSGLETRGVTELSGLIGQMRERHAAVVYEQTARARAVGVLRKRCDRLCTELHPSTPSGRVLDEIETAMRWMMLLRIELAGTQLGLMLSTIEERIGGPIDTLGPGRVAEVLSDAISVVHSVVERFEGAGNRRLAAPVGLAMARWCAHLDDVAAPVTEGKAGRRLIAGYEVKDWTQSMWARWWWLRPVCVMDGIPEGAGEDDRLLLTRRYGLGGEKPWTLGELGEKLGTPAMHVGRMVQGALRRCDGMKNRTEG
jgi:hypothetical protein